MATKLGLDPDTVLEWRESKLLMWSGVADIFRRQELLVEMAALTVAVWDPKSLPKVLGQRRAPMSQEEKTRALAVAEKVQRIRMKEGTIQELKGVL